uniref:Protein kinase domain-containing protein n=1 Tax=Tetradesmus obliquus TaxID=3088 RepID=A0A383VFW0_TETOB|eukprot:jgi/Sobl393_1/17056/SZX64081.1
MGKPLTPSEVVLDVNEKVLQQSKPKGCRARGCVSDYWSNVRARPAFMLLVPVLVFCVLCSLGIVGVKLGADQFEAETRARAQSVAMDWASSFRMSAERVFTPLVTLDIIIQRYPDVAQLKKVFPEAAKQLFDRVNADRAVIQELQVSPMGVIELIYPLNAATENGLGLDIFAQPALRGGALKTLEAHDIVLNGPLQLVGSNFAAVARIPIFIANASLSEDFGSNKTLPTNCSAPLCFNPASREKFWGFATAISPMDDLRAGNDSRLDLFKQSNYRWAMTRPYTATERDNSKLFKPQSTLPLNGEFVFSNSSTWPGRQAVQSTIHIANADWQVFLEPAAGWRPAWEKGLAATAVLGAGIIGVLVGTILASWAQQQKLLGEVMERNEQLAETTAKLQEEKMRLDALLVRQYNLVAVLGRAAGKDGGKDRDRDVNGGSGTGGGSPDNSTSASREGLTLDRIEAMRRQLAVNTNTALQDIGSIQQLELLGKGTFGKVYKGLWRGTVVAVKTMLLPSNMSGSEKREKMAVMEAAISSSLSHPNVVQTYTYAIRAIRELPEEGTGSPRSGEPSAAPTTSPSASESARLESLRLSSTSVPALHSYEVRLVLEFCDKGCLREALDAGAFLLAGGGVNYAAILDTAADVAKAMLHLHSLNVLHSDLKAQNVMMASGNSDGRGVVAKVGDFGLSLKMDHTATHISSVYQGTLTHMAPEVMLSGRVSKAADVYAFGITLWELYTGRRAFEGVPRALLGHQVTREALRPKFPPGTPLQYKTLAERCWHTDWEKRPEFSGVLSELLAMRAADPRRTPAISLLMRQQQHELDDEKNDAFLAAAGRNSNSNHSPMLGVGLPAAAAAAAAAAAGLERPGSVYLEHSLEDSELLVMRTMSDWSHEGQQHDDPHGSAGGSSSSMLEQQQQQPGGSYHRSRSTKMPQIDEVEGEAGSEGEGEGGQQQGQQSVPPA